MENIKYQTGRAYDGAQVLDINVHRMDEDEYGIIEVDASFSDSSRHIKGRINTLVFDGNIGRAVLKAYDQGDYTQE